MPLQLRVGFRSIEKEKTIHSGNLFLLLRVEVGSTSAEGVGDQQVPPPPEQDGMGLSRSGIDELMEITSEVN